MKKFLIICTVLALVACKNEKQKLEDNVKSLLFEYYTNEIAKDKDASQTVLDSVVITKIDTVSDLALAKYKYVYFNNIFDQESAIVKLEQERFKLQTESYKGSSEKPSYLELERERINEKYEKLKINLNKQQEIIEQINSKKLDSLNFLFYAVEATLYTTEEKTTEKNLKTLTFVTKNLKIKDLGKEWRKELNY